MTISTTRIFKSGNSLAVRIPEEMTPADVPEQAQVEWHNGVWTLRPLHRCSLAGLMDRFKAFSPDFMASGRALLDQAPRQWPEAAKAPATRRRAPAKN